MNIFKQIYYHLFPNWKVVKVIQGQWLTVIGNYIYSYAVYEILYSKRLNRYKLKCSGTKCKEHPNYPEVIKTLNQLNNEYRKDSKENG